MPVFKPDIPELHGVDEFTTQAANAAQLVAEEGVELDDEAQAQLRSEDGPAEDADAAAEVPCDRSPLQTREAYLKKGEDLIRSLL